MVGVLAGIGKPVLRNLGQDIIGTMPSEQTEIAVAGGCVGMFGGIIVGVILFSAVWPSRIQTQANSTDAPPID